MTTACRHSIVLQRHEASQKASHALVGTYALHGEEAHDGLPILTLAGLALRSSFDLAILLNPLLPF